MKRSITRRTYRCFYCLVPLVTPNSGTDDGNSKPNLRTREHLIPIADGGDNKSDNLRWACRACNNYVGCWSLERKLRFRVLMRQIGVNGTIKLRSMFTGKDRSRKISELIDSIPTPNDAQSNRARLAQLRIERKVIEGCKLQLRNRQDRLRAMEDRYKR